MKSKFLMLLMATASLQVGIAQTKTLTVSFQNQPIQKALDEIEKKSGYRFFYNNNQIDLSHKVTLKADNKSINDVLKGLFQQMNVSYRIMDTNIILSNEGTSQEDQRMIWVSGRVSDKNHKALPGITLKYANREVTTDSNGNFRIQAAEGTNIDVFSLGYQRLSVKADDSKALQLTLIEESEAIDEVVVTALGVKREKKALGYAVQKIGGEDITTAKGVDVATSLTGRIAGLNIKNSTEFNTTPTIELRGQRNPLIVIDGVATQFVSLRDVPADDIKDITVLKGATSSALYGPAAAGGAIMITTKKSEGKGMSVQINSSTMVDAGYLIRPEVQTSYSSGQGGKYAAGSYVWGDKLDIGRKAMIHNPFTFKKEETLLESKGKRNLENFQQRSLIANNNISISQRGENGGVRASFTHVYNRGQYDNNKLNKLTYAVSGDMTAGKFKFEGGINYNKRYYPNMGGTGYGGGSILYNTTVWSGTEYDIRDYKNYWEVPNEKQNWMDASWYDNPYFIVNEIIRGSDYNILNGYLNTEVKATDWLTLNARIGTDTYSRVDQSRNPIGAGGADKLGAFSMTRAGGYSVNSDFMATAKKTVNDFYFEGFVGTGINYRNNDAVTGSTQGGLSVPGFYSLNASVSPATTSSSLSRKQDNSIYGRFSTSWKNAVFLDLTGRNDWSSTLDKNNRSFFYPSVASSVVMSELIKLPKAISFWKVRGSWTQTKMPPGIYAINQFYSISSDVWNGLGTANYPSTLRSSSIKPVATDTWEIGTEFSLLNNRIHIDAAYYNMLTYNQQRSAGISSASGFSTTQINIKEDLRRKGIEIVLNADVVKNDNFKWSSGINWSRDRYTYDKVDPEYSTDKPWVKEGARWNWVSVYDWERDPQDNMIHYNGLPRASAYETLAGFNEADFIWGWNNSFTYKNFNLSFSFDGRVGGITHSITDQAMWNSGSHPDSDNADRYDMVVNGKSSYVGQGVKIVSGSVDYDSYGNITRDDRVYAPNDRAVSYETYQVRMAPYIGSVRSQFLFSQTFVKLRDLSFTYTVPKYISAKLKAKDLSVGFIGQNLWMWAKDFKYSDPDVGSDNLNSASIRYIGGNVKIQF